MAREERRHSRVIERRKSIVLSAAFQLFASSSIEEVKMEDITKKSEFGVASLYRYYGTKTALTIEVAETKWREFVDMLSKSEARNVPIDANAAMELQHFLSVFQVLLHSHKDLAKFIVNFSSFLNHEKIPESSLKGYRKASEELVTFFKEHVYDKALNDGSVRTNLPLITTYRRIVVPCLSLAGRYAATLRFSIRGDFDGEAAYAFIIESIYHEMTSGLCSAKPLSPLKQKD